MLEVRQGLTAIYTSDMIVIYTNWRSPVRTAIKMTSIRLDTRLADDAARLLGARSRTEAVHIALREIVALKRFKDLMKKHGGKLRFAGHEE